MNYAIEQQFAKLIEQCEQQNYFMEYRATNQITGSDARFIEIDTTKFGYQHLVALGFNPHDLNLHQLITLDSQLEISKQLQYILYQNDDNQPVFLLLRLKYGQVIIKAEKSQATRKQLNLKIYPLSQIKYNSNNLNFDNKVAIIMQQPDTTLKIEKSIYNTKTGKYFVITSDLSLNLQFYLSYIYHSKLQDYQTFDITPISFTDNLNTDSFNHHLYFYYNFIQNWINNEYKTTELFNLYHKLQERQTDIMLQQYLIKEIFALVIQNPYQLTNIEKNKIIDILYQSKFKYKNQHIIFLSLFQNEIERHKNKNNNPPKNLHTIKIWK